MSCVEVELCTVILEDHFGHFVSSVGRLLLVRQLALPLIHKWVEAKMSVKELKRSLAILEHHGLLDIKLPAGDRGAIQYSVPRTTVLRLLRIPRSAYVIKTLHGKVPSVIFEKLASAGRLSCSECIKCVCALTKCTEREALEALKRLCDARLIMRCPPPAFTRGENEEEYGIYEGVAENGNRACSSNSSFLPGSFHEGNMFVLPSKLLDGGKGSGGSGAKDSDLQTLWCVNWDRVDCRLRDELVIEQLALNEGLDKSALSVARLLLRVAEAKGISGPAGHSGYVSLQEMSRYAAKHDFEETGIPKSEEGFIAKLMLLVGEPDTIIHRIGESNGGVYNLDYEGAISRLSFHRIDSVVEKKLSKGSLRVFRLLRQLGNLEEEQIERHAILPSADVRKACSALLEGGFMAIRHACKFTDFAPSRTFYLCTVPLPLVLATTMQLAHLTLRNLITRRIHEAKKHKALTSRQFKLEGIVANIKADTTLDDETKESQIAEHQLTAGEKLQLERFAKAQRRLWASEVEVEKELFTLQQHLQVFHAAQAREAEALAMAGPSRKRRRKSTL